MVIPPNSFATESKSRIRVTLQQQVDSSQHDFWQTTYSFMASQGNHELRRRRDSRIYFEVPLCRWDWEISLFARDSISMGGARRLMPFPYLVEFPVRSLYFPTDCEGARDFHGWSEVLYANSNQGTLLATREFQSRYWLMNCQENEFMTYIRNRQMDMRQLDSLTSNHLVDHMITWWNDPITYREDSVRRNCFATFEEFGHLGVANTEAVHRLRSNQHFDWEIAQGLIRKVLLKKNKKQWIHRRNFVQVLMGTESVLVCQSKAR